MKKLTEMQKQYQGYAAAIESVKKTDPGDVEVVYKEAGYAGDEGIFIYNSREDRVEIKPRRGSTSDYVWIEAGDLPALVKALREFIE
jgi:hypothetical protein